LYLPAFLVAALRTARQASQAAGVLAVKVLGDRRNAYWTLTMWESEEAMRGFMHAAPHGPTMRKLLDWCDEAAVVHWEQPDGELPSWVVAHERMLSEGRRSKVRHPSAGQVAFRWDAPPEHPKNARTFKEAGSPPGAGTKPAGKGA
jgi:hypothetical protein